jgi:Protein of unknown function (DUF3251)
MMWRWSIDCESVSIRELPSTMFRNPLRFLVCAASIAALESGCDPNSASLQADLANLKKIIAIQTAALDHQSNQIEILKWQIEWMQNKTVTVDPSTPGYQCIDSNTGKFLISCDNAQSFLDGQKLTFRIGNPTFVTYSGFKLKAKWGPKAPVFNPDNREPNQFDNWQVAYKAWQQSLHEKEIDSAADLKPGIWNTVEVILAPAKPDELGHIEISMTTDKISLYRDKGQ